MDDKKARQKAYLRQYYLDHRETLKKRANDNYHANIEVERAKRRAYRHTHVEEKRERDRLYRESHQEQMKVWKKIHYANNKARILEEQRIFRTTERYRAQRAARKGKNQDQIRAWGRANYWRHADQLRAKTRTYRQTHRHLTNFYSRRYKARRRGASGSFTLAEWQAMCEFFGGACLVCGIVTTLTVDHVEPISQGGSNYIENLQPLCGPCNSSKSAKTIDYRDPERLAAFLESLTASKD